MRHKDEGGATADVALGQKGIPRTRIGVRFTTGMSALCQKQMNGTAAKQTALVMMSRYLAWTLVTVHSISWLQWIGAIASLAT